VTYLQDRSVYEDRYDSITVELCRIREERVVDALGERPPLDANGDADPANGYYVYSIFYFQFVESLAGERWQEREAKIRKWIGEGEEKDQRLAEARPSTIPYCRSCGEDMHITDRLYHRRRASRGKKDEDAIMFMFDCPQCKKRLAFWEDGTEWKPPQARCEACNKPVDETTKRRGMVITTTYTCASCGHKHKGSWRLGGDGENDAPDPLYKLDRRRFCFDAATGEKFLARKAHIEHIGKLLEQGRQSAGATKETVDPMAEAVEGIKKLKMAQLADVLAKAVADSGYIEFKLGEPQIGREVAVPFSCLDNQPEREAYDSRMGLKRLVTRTLADTNWRLMSDGISHRLGYLSGRLRAYESDEDLRMLVNKQAKGARPQPPQVRPAATPEPAAPEEPATPPKRSRRGKERAIRVRGILHPNLHMLIPPRETAKPLSKGKQRKT
jgi:hypothetical protein